LSCLFSKIVIENGDECCTLAPENSNNPTYSGIEAFLTKRISESKPTSRPYRRMAVALVNDTLEPPSAGASSQFSYRAPVIYLIHSFFIKLQDEKIR
jgi:hypothetical protein